MKLRETQMSKPASYEVAGNADVQACIKQTLEEKHKMKYYHGLVSVSMETQL